eukprot:3347149-Alexandrium_andersonii.AAC.1
MLLRRQGYGLLGASLGGSTLLRCCRRQLGGMGCHSPDSGSACGPAAFPASQSIRVALTRVLEQSSCIQCVALQVRQALLATC